MHIVYLPGVYFRGVVVTSLAESERVHAEHVAVERYVWLPPGHHPRHGIPHLDRKTEVDVAVLCEAQSQNVCRMIDKDLIPDVDRLSVAAAD